MNESVPPPPTIVQENPEFTAWVERRAIDLCTDPQPDRPNHNTANGVPCLVHLRFARRQGFDYWDEHP